MKRLRVLLFASVITLLVVSLVISCAAPAPAPKEKVILRMPLSLPAGDWVELKCREFAETFNDRAAGEYEMETYPAGSLLQVPEYIDAVRTGTVEMTQSGWGNYGGLDPRFGVFDTPFLFNNIKAVVASQEDFVKLFDAILQEKFNQKALASYPVGVADLISKRPVKTLEDWKGLLVATPTPQLSALTNALGGAAVTIVWTETYSVLEKGTVDATIQARPFLIIGNLYEVAHYVTSFDVNSCAMGYSINLDLWNKMPERIQNILLEEAQLSAQRISEEAITRYDEEIETLTALGAEVYVLPKAERDRWHELLLTYIDEQLSGLGEFGQEMKKIADKVNIQYP